MKKEILHYLGAKYFKIYSLKIFPGQKKSLIGLIHQKSFQQMADEKGLHVVEFREDRDNYPVVRASPSGRCKTDEEIGSDEILDFHMYLHDGKVRAQTVKKARILYTTSSLANISEKVALLSQQRSGQSQSDRQIRGFG
jgi:hypothetical protein